MPGPELQATLCTRGPAEEGLNTPNPARGYIPWTLLGGYTPLGGGYIPLGGLHIPGGATHPWGGGGLHTPGGATYPWGGATHPWGGGATYPWGGGATHPWGGGYTPLGGGGGYTPLGGGGAYTPLRGGGGIHTPTYLQDRQRTLTSLTQGLRYQRHRLGMMRLL